ncbi:Hypothetical predicted protein, partial [Podarcis lilfordi]
AACYNHASESSSSDSGSGFRRRNRHHLTIDWVAGNLNEDNFRSISGKNNNKGLAFERPKINHPPPKNRSIEDTVGKIVNNWPVQNRKLSTAGVMMNFHLRQLAPIDDSANVLLTLSLGCGSFFSQGATFPPGKPSWGHRPVLGGTTGKSGQLGENHTVKKTGNQCTSHPVSLSREKLQQYRLWNVKQCLRVCTISVQTQLLHIDLSKAKHALLSCVTSKTCICKYLKTTRLLIVKSQSVMHSAFQIPRYAFQSFQSLTLGLLTCLLSKLQLTA